LCLRDFVANNSGSGLSGLGAKQLRKTLTFLHTLAMEPQKPKDLEIKRLYAPKEVFFYTFLNAWEGGDKGRFLFLIFSWFI
jgi:hypothetical protein